MVLLVGLAIVATCIAAGFIPMTHETYQAIRIWSHAFMGGAMGIGLVMIFFGIGDLLPPRS